MPLFDILREETDSDSALLWKWKTYLLPAAGGPFCSSYSKVKRVTAGRNLSKSNIATTDDPNISEE